MATAATAMLSACAQHTQRRTSGARGAMIDRDGSSGVNDGGSTREATAMVTAERETTAMATAATAILNTTRTAQTIAADQSTTSTTTSRFV